MLSYRHAFHAGNFADVIKHFLIVSCIDYLQQKNTAIRFIDTHCGSGIYRLDNEMAIKLNESENGIIKLLKFYQNESKKFSLSEKSQLYLQKYIDLVNSFNTKKNIVNLVEKYPGSPFLITHLMRTQDDAFFYELHPKDFDYLNNNFNKYFRKKLNSKKISSENTNENSYKISKNYHLFNSDGYKGLKANIISPSKRALVLIDPSYEIATDYENVLLYLNEALQRLKNATYCVWYPLLNKRESFQLADRLIHLIQKENTLVSENKQNKISWLNTKFWVKNQQKYASMNTENKFMGLLGTGMFIVNPPYFFPQLLNEIFELFNTIFLQEKVNNPFEILAEIF